MSATVEDLLEFYRDWGFVFESWVLTSTADGEGNRETPLDIMLTKLEDEGDTTPCKYVSGDSDPKEALEEVLETLIGRKVTAVNEETGGELRIGVTIDVQAIIDGLSSDLDSNEWYANFELRAPMRWCYYDGSAYMAGAVAKQLLVGSDDALNVALEISLSYGGVSVAKIEDNAVLRCGVRLPYNLFDIAEASDSVPRTLIEEATEALNLYSGEYVPATLVFNPLGELVSYELHDH